MTEPSAGSLTPAPQSWWSRMWGPFWALPLAIIIASAIAGLTLPSLDERLRHVVPYVFQGGPDSARSLLSNIASAMISVTGLVFSITMVVLQLASSQFTPRVLTGFLRNRVSQVTLGIFTATFVFSLTVLRSVRSGSIGFVPQSSVTIAFALVMASVAMFIAFIHHITTSIQVSRVISAIGDDTARVLERYFTPPENGDGATGDRAWSNAGAGGGRVITVGDRHGYVTDIWYADLVELATRIGGRITLELRAGEMRTSGHPLARVLDADLDDETAEAIRRCVRLSTDRELRVDPAYGIRQLVDIAARALSPGINDPTTAVECLDELHRLLRPLVQRENPVHVFGDVEGIPRLRWQPPTVAELLELALLEPIHYGHDAPSVRERLRTLLDDLRPVCRSEHRESLDRLAQNLARLTSA